MLPHVEEMIAFHQRDLDTLREYEALLQRCKLAGLSADNALDQAMRAQLWQWLHHRAVLDDGRSLTPELLDDLFADELSKLGEDTAQAGPLFKQVATQTPLVDFLTLPGYAALE